MVIGYASVIKSGRNIDLQVDRKWSMTNSDMKTFIIELPEEETKLFKQLLKKLNGRIVSKGTSPNKETIDAMNELKQGKGVKFSSASDPFKSV